MYSLFTWIFLAWIILCGAGLMAVIFLIIEEGSRFKPSGWFLAIVLFILLIVGVDWGLDHLEETVWKAKMAERSTEQSREVEYI